MSNLVKDNTMVYDKEQEINITKTNRKNYLFAKRTFDILGALSGILLLSWLFLVIAILIKIEDPHGKVMFSQNRVGKNCKLFKMYKFRSMVSNAEQQLDDLLKYNEVSGEMFKIKDDPRVTKVGKFIRKTSIDELPQLFNVLKGDMSLVGPRPPLQREVQNYTKYHLQRLMVTPGCTGLWQATSRNSVGFEEMVELDLEYIRKRSIFFDLNILFKTVFILFGSKNAY